jgi:hypothetical protein
MAWLSLIVEVRSLKFIEMESGEIIRSWITDRIFPLGYLHQV